MLWICKINDFTRGKEHSDPCHKELEFQSGRVAGTDPEYLATI
jgi:hypothetical protein